MFSGLFSKKNNGPAIKDFVYMHRAARWQGAMQLWEKGNTAILVNWFPETAEQFQQFIQQSGVNKPEIYVAPQVRAHEVAHKTVIFLEHYPLAEKESNLWQHWQAKEIIVISSLDEPLFQYFGGERIAGLMKQLGAAENEAIQHALITKAIRNAQEKLAGKVMVEHSAQSAEEWFRKNVPPKTS